MSEPTKFDFDDSKAKPNPDEVQAAQADSTPPKKDEKKEGPTKEQLAKLVPGDTVVETQGAPVTLDATKRSSSSSRYIQYDGVATVRILDQSAWEAAGVESDDYFEWNYLNHKRIPIEAFSDAQLQYMLRVDGRFSIVEIEDEDDEDSEDNGDKALDPAFENMLTGGNDN